MINNDFIRYSILFFFFFFFQAEDGIRDTSVTGVQTCALPISDRDDAPGGAAEWADQGIDADRTERPDRLHRQRQSDPPPDRSEERRVGKECRTRWAP